VSFFPFDPHQVGFEEHCFLNRFLLGVQDLRRNYPDGDPDY